MRVSMAIVYEHRAWKSWKRYPPFGMPARGRIEQPRTPVTATLQYQSEDDLTSTPISCVSVRLTILIRDSNARRPTWELSVRIPLNDADAALLEATGEGSAPRAQLLQELVPGQSILERLH